MVPNRAAQVPPIGPTIFPRLPDEVRLSDLPELLTRSLRFDSKRLNGDLLETHGGDLLLLPLFLSWKRNLRCRKAGIRLDICLLPFWGLRRDQWVCVHSHADSSPAWQLIASGLRTTSGWRRFIASRFRKVPVPTSALDQKCHIFPLALTTRSALFSVLLRQLVGYASGQSTQTVNLFR